MHRSGTRRAEAQGENPMGIGVQERVRISSVTSRGFGARRAATMIRPILILAAASACVLPLRRAAAADLSPDEISGAISADSLSVPTPGELMAALGKEGKPSWQAYFRKPVPSNFTSRPQIALNLGALIADGYIAVEAADGQQVKNIGKEIIELARTLGVSESVIGRGNSIIEFAENNDWEVLREELEATQNEVKLAMSEQRDEALISLVTLGGWIRGTDVVTSWISENYTAASAKLLRQPAIASQLRAKIESLPERMRDDPCVKLVAKQIEEIERLVSFPPGDTPSPETVRALRDLAAALVTEIGTAKK
jgi:hypothetical protein